MAGKVINIHDAKIKTVQVGIKAMTINDRQVTLAVFRQLVEKELISEAGTLNGLPWGFVNYHPDKCSDDRAHWHIVWQEGEDLRRATINKTPVFASFYSGKANALLDCIVRDMAMGRRIEQKVKSDGSPYNWKFYGQEVLAFPSTQAKIITDCWFVNSHCERGFSDQETIDHEQRKEDFIARHGDPDEYGAPERPDRPKWWRRDEWNGPHYFPCEAVKINEAIDAIHGEYHQAHQELLAAVREEIARRKRWIDTTAAMASLPQLFVAV